MTNFRSVIEGDVLENSYNMILQNAGYYTGQLGKYGVRSSEETLARYDFFDGSQDQGPPFRDYKGKTLHDSEWLTQRTSDFLDSIPNGKPFCLQVNYKAPHASSVPWGTNARTSKKGKEGGPKSDEQLPKWKGFSPLPLPSSPK